MARPSKFLTGTESGPDGVPDSSFRLRLTGTRISERPILHRAMIRGRSNATDKIDIRDPDFFYPDSGYSSSLAESQIGANSGFVVNPVDICCGVRTIHDNTELVII